MKKFENFLFDMVVCMLFGYFGGWLFLYFCCDENELACKYKTPPAAVAVANHETIPKAVNILYVAKNDKTKTKTKKNRKADK